MLANWYSVDAGGVHPLLVVLVAFAVDAAVGDPPRLYDRFPHPAALFGQAVAAAERRLNRPSLGPRILFRRGMLATLALVAGAAGIGYAVQAALSGVRHGWVGVAILGAVLIAYRSLHDHVRAVAEGLDRSLDEGREAVRHVAGRDPEALDAHGTARAAVESLAENFSDGVVAPVFWFALFGLPGLCACKAVNTLDSMIGHRDPRHERFGKFAARLDDAANFVPARLAGLLLAVAAPRRAGAAWRAMTRDAARHRSVNAGWPEAAMAGALGLALAGPRRYAGETVGDAWMNRDGRAEAEAGDIRRALAVYRRAAGALGALLLAVVALA